MYKVNWDAGELNRVLDLLRIEIMKADLRLDVTSEDFWRGVRQKLDDAEFEEDIN